MAVVEGLEEGMENASPEKARERDAFRGRRVGKRGQQRVGIRRRGCRRARRRGWPREIKREEIPVD